MEISVWALYEGWGYFRWIEVSSDSVRKGRRACTCNVAYLHTIHRTPLTFCILEILQHPKAELQFVDTLKGVVIKNLY